MRHIVFLLVFLFSSAALAKTFQVGPTRTYTTPSKVMGLVSDGDTVLIDAGLYSGDVGTWAKNNLVIRGVGGYAHLDAAGKNQSGKAIWVIDGKNTYIENIEFSGCTVADHNGAGIRQEADNLELRHCYFHDNEDGVLTSASPTSDILFEACEFARNGYGDGYSHNMYIGNIRTFTMRFCYSHHAKVGHCVKSRAMNNFIEYNRIMDEDTGSASYLINLPNGGFSIVLGNTMQKGANAQNRTLVDYGSEGLSNPSKQLYVVNNTMVSQRPSGVTFVSNASANDSLAQVMNNIFAGTGTIFSGMAYTTANVYSADLSFFGFANVSNYDYHLVSSSIIHLYHGVNPDSVNGISLVPYMEYVSDLDSSTREIWTLPIPGALTFLLDGVKNSASIKLLPDNFPNPFSDKTTINLGDGSDGLPVTMNIYNPLGEKILARNYTIENSRVIFERGNLSTGVYYYEVVNSKDERIGVGRFVIL